MTLQSAARSNASSNSPGVRKRQIAIVLFSVAIIIMCVSCRGSTEPRVPSVWTGLAAHDWYTCGLSPAGEAYCWGGVSGGWRGIPPIADSIAPNSAVPLRVPGGRRYVEITVGETPICALDEGRAAFCWGPNQTGEVGDSSFVAKRGPSPVEGGHRWKMVDAGMSHVCGITLAGVTYCWGNNFRGALGLGNGNISGASAVPLSVSGGISFSSVWAGGGTSCALTAAGEAYCWGINDFGMVGDGNSPEAGPENPTPSPVTGGYRFKSLSIGNYNVCGIALDARAYCWGYGGVLGNGSTEPSSVPVPVSGNLTWTSLSVGNGHTCGLSTEGQAYCWGNGEGGRFGTGDTTVALGPLPIAAAGVYSDVVAGGRHTCARTAAGTAFCWGVGQYGQLGHGLMRNELRPVQVAGYE